MDITERVRNFLYVMMQSNSAREDGTLLEALNEDLEWIWGLIELFRYEAIEYPGTVDASDSRVGEFRQFLRGEIETEFERAWLLTDIIIKNGARPTRETRQVTKPGSFSEMLKLDIELTEQQRDRYREQARMAAECGKSELEEQLLYFQNTADNRLEELRALE
ncbi:MAG: ferritin-like domain-containing protein [bacterium]